MTTWGIVLGRFQPVHIGHIEYLTAALERCERLVVGITNPDTSSRIHTAADPRRSEASANPYTYSQRQRLIEGALLEAGWNAEQFLLTPAPVREPEKLVEYLPGPDESLALLTVYDAWGDEKVALMRELGYPVDVMWRRTHEERVTSGTEVRRLMVEGGEWRQLVPPFVARELDEWQRNDGARSR